MSDEGGLGDDLVAAYRHHRYELAAELLEGRRVADLWCGAGDGAAILAGTAESVVGVDPDARLTGSATAPPGLPVSFEHGDVQEWLAALPPTAVDAIVCLTGLDSAPDPEALVDLLDARARDGAAVVVSAGPATDRLLDRLGGAVVLHQHFVEGSLITGPPSGTGNGAGEGPISGRSTPAPGSPGDRLAVVGVAVARVRECVARRAVHVTVGRTLQLEELERENRSLRRANAMLGRDVFGTWDSAAAAFLARHTDEVERLKAEIAELTERAVRAEYSAWENDQWLQEERRNNGRLQRLEARLKAVATPSRGGPRGRR